ncbi:MAG: hypothetical protein IJD28_03390 [Deferribacterales bacterium]|nr:hypothetical protein [Deferribacterales bacterium]
MKKIFLSIGAAVLLCGTAFADNWLEKDLAPLSKDVKTEIVKMYNDIFQNAAKERIKIVRTADELAKAIESNVDKAKRDALIQQLTNQVVTLSDDMRMDYSKLSAKAGSLSPKFEKEKAGDDDADDFYNKIFTSEGVEDIYDLLDEAGIQTPTKKQIKAQYGNMIRTVKNNFRNAYNRYRGFWMAGITSGTEFENAKKAYAEAVKNMITLSADIYAAEIMKLNPQQIKQVANERQRITNKQIRKINEKATTVNIKTQNRLNSLEQQ